MNRVDEGAKKIVPKRGQHVCRPCRQWLQSLMCAMRCSIIGVVWCGGIRRGWVWSEKIRQGSDPRGSKRTGNTSKRERLKNVKQGGDRS